MYSYTIQRYSDDGIFMKNNKSIAIIPNQDLHLNENDYFLGSKISFTEYKERRKQEINNLYLRKSNFEVFKLNFQDDVLCVCHPKHLTDIRVEELDHLNTNPPCVDISNIDDRGNPVKYDSSEIKCSTLAILTKQYIYIYNNWTTAAMESYLSSQGFISIIKTAYVNNRFLLGYHPIGYVALTNHLEKSPTSFLRFKSTPNRIRDTFSNTYCFSSKKKNTKLFKNELVGLQEPKYGWILFHSIKALTSVYRKRLCDNTPLCKTNYSIVAENRVYTSTIRDKKEMEHQLTQLNIQFEFKKTPSKEIYTLKQL